MIFSENRGTLFGIMLESRQAAAMHPGPRRPDFEASDASLIASTAAFLIALTPADKRRPAERTVSKNSSA
jgi:hypothetical protein